MLETAVTTRNWFSFVAPEVMPVRLTTRGPLLSVMKVERAPPESYPDVSGLEDQIQEIKEAVELPLPHPEIYEDIGIIRRRES